MAALESLWEYQQADLALDRFENQLMKSETRRKLLKSRNAIMEQQARIKKLEKDLQTCLSNCSRLSAEQQKLAKLAEDTQQQFVQADEELDAVRGHIRRMDDIHKALNALKRDLTQMQNLATGAEGIIKDVRSKLATGKTEFDGLKKQHDDELEKAKPEMEHLRQNVQQKESLLPTTEMDEYKRIKKNRPNPVALVVNEQCGGCYMSLPSLMMRRLREGGQLIECENCGRILYYKED